MSKSEIFTGLTGFNTLMCRPKASNQFIEFRVSGSPDWNEYHLNYGWNIHMEFRISERPRPVEAAPRPSVFFFIHLDENDHAVGIVRIAGQGAMPPPCKGAVRVIRATAFDAAEDI